MKILKGVTVVTTVVLALAALGSAAGTVTTSSYVVEPRTVPGVSTGLVLKKGKPVTVTATGVVCANFTNLCVTPAGDGLVDTDYTGNGGFEQPDAPAYGLIGRVGSGPWVEVGSGPTPLSGKGELVFAVNDDAYGDNTGNFFVAVSYTASAVNVTRTCWPGWGYGDTNHEHCGPPGLANKPEQSSQPTQGSSNEHGQSGENEHGKSGEKGNSSNK
jgi:hypothetical protein